MNWCDINLAQGLIYSRQRRLVLHWAMTGYLLATAVLLGLTLVKAAANVRRGLEFHHMTGGIQARFKKQYPDKLSLVDCATELKESLRRHAAEVAAISTALPARIQTTLPVLMALANPSDQSEIYNLAFIQQMRNKHPSLEFSLCMPIENKANPEFLDTWRRNEPLAKEIENIVPVTTKRGRVNNRNVSIMSYQAEFRK